MGGKSTPAPPDYGPLVAASEKSAEYAYNLGKEQLAWAKEQFAQNKDVSDSVIDAALGRMDRLEGDAIEDREFYEANFQPLEEQLARDAQDYASPERMERAAGKAEANVAQKFEQQRQTAMRELETRGGVDPSMTRHNALNLQSRVAQAAVQAGAGEQARDATEARGMALRSEAINVGRGYPGQIAGSYATAGNAGNQAVNSGLATTQSGAGTMGTPLGWQGAGNQAVGMQGQLMNMAFDNEMDAWKAQNAGSSGWGGALGTIAGLGSKMLFAADGGAIPEEHGGVEVDPTLSPSRGGALDDVPAMLNAGEFVIPADVVAYKGEEFFQRLIEKTRGSKGDDPAKPKQGSAPRQAPALDTSGVGAY